MTVGEETTNPHALNQADSPRDGRRAARRWCRRRRAGTRPRNETVFFEAPSDLVERLGDEAGEDAQAARVTRGARALRIVLYWGTVAPNPNHKRRPNFNQASPAAYHWGPYDRLVNKAAALHWTVLLTVSGPVPRWATPHGEDRYSDPSATDFGLFMHGRGQALRKQGEALLDLERAQSAGFSATAVRSRSAGLPGDLPWPLPRRLQRIAGLGQLLRHARADGRDLSGRRAGDPGAAGLPAGGALPELELPAGGALLEVARGWLRAAPVLGVPRTVLDPAGRRCDDRHHGTSGRGARPGGRGGRHQPRHAGIHHRVRRPELPEHRAGCARRPAGGVRRDGRADRLARIRALPRSPSICCATTIPSMATSSASSRGSRPMPAGRSRRMEVSGCPSW